MEQIEAQIQEKGIEKSDDVIPQTNLGTSGVQTKPRKPRSQAQKDAFEKARKKRAENLAKKKLEQEKVVSVSPANNQIQQVEDLPPQSGELELTAPSVVDDVGENVSRPTPKGKKRGRPKGAKGKKLKREIEPELGQPNFLPPNQPPPPGDLRYQYQYPHPMMYQQPPQVHNYYYGHQQGAVNQAPPEPSKPPTQNYPTPPTPTLDNEPFLSSSEEEEAHSDYLIPPEPDLKYRFA